MIIGAIMIETTSDQDTLQSFSCNMAISRGYTAYHIMHNSKKVIKVFMQTEIIIFKLARAIIKLVTLAPGTLKSYASCTNLAT